MISFVALRGRFHTPREGERNLGKRETESLGEKEEETGSERALKTMRDGDQGGKEKFSRSFCNYPGHRCLRVFSEERVKPTTGKENSEQRGKYPGKRHFCIIKKTCCC